MNEPPKDQAHYVIYADVIPSSLGGADLLSGASFFYSAIIQIDYPNSRLRRLSKKSVDLRKQTNVPMKRARGSVFPATEVESEGENVWLIFDTGNAGGVKVKGLVGYEVLKHFVVTIDYKAFKVNSYAP